LGNNCEEKKAFMFLRSGCMGEVGRGDGKKRIEPLREKSREA